MARPLRIQYPGALYHLINRGNDRQDIFRDDFDRKEFLTILSRSAETYSITLYGFVLMKNHWHLLARTPLGNLSEFMRHFNISYTSYYNRRHNRSGHLYQGRYKSYLVERDGYLSQVSRYIHLNPVKVSGMEQMAPARQILFLWNYRWSSLPGYISKANRFDFIDYSIVLEEYGGDNRDGRNRYRDQILNDLPAGIEMSDKVVGQFILGSENFVSWVQDTFLEGKADRERPAVRKINSYISLEQALRAVENETGVKDGRRSTGTVRQIVMTILYSYAGLNNREIGELLGVDYSTVSQGRKRLRQKISKDRETETLWNRITDRVSRIKI